MEDDEEIMYPDEAQTWSMLIHLSAFSGFFTGVGFLLCPLILWLLKREESSIVDAQGKEALNFQLTTAVYLIICIALSLSLSKFILLYLLLIAWMVVVIQAAQAANEGRPYRYPVTLRLLK